MTEYPHRIRHAGGVLTLDFDVARRFLVLLAGDVSDFSVSSLPQGASGRIALRQDALGGRSVTLPLGWSEGQPAAEVDTGADALSVLMLHHRAGGYVVWRGRAEDPIFQPALAAEAVIDSAPASRDTLGKISGELDALAAGKITARLSAIDAATPAADRVLFASGPMSFSWIAASAYGRSLLAAADAPTALGVIGAQAADATLTALAALSSSTGMLAQTGADAFVKRTLTAPNNGLTWSGTGDGASGNPAIIPANDLAALEALTGTGFPARTGTDAYAIRSLAVASTARLTVSNPDGAAGAPTFDLAATTVAPGSYGSATQVGTFTVDAYGRLTAAGNAVINLAWGAVTGRPTTLSGYGITDAQPLDPDLTSLATVTGTNTIYYRSAANIWSPVIIGSGVSFSGGSLSATGSGGTVTSVGLTSADLTVSGGPVTGSGSITANLATQAGVTAATYGGASQVAQFAVNSKGVITGVSGVPIAINAAAVSGLATVATSGSAADLGSGTLPDARLSNTITAGGAIGDSSHVAQITYDAHGRLTTVASVAITAAALGAEVTSNKDTSGGYAGFTIGLWTPTVSLATPGTSSFAYTTQSGSYRTFGDMVYIEFTVTFTPSVGTGAGNLLIDVPFNIASLNATGQVRSMSSAFNWGTGYTQMILAGNTTTALTVNKMGSGLAAATLTAAGLTSGSSHIITGAIWYRK